MLELNDKLFLALAKKAGFPSREALKKAKANKGDLSLFEAVRDAGEITDEQVKKLERWAKQIKRGDLSPLEGGDPSKASASGTGQVGAGSGTGSAGKLKTPSVGKVAAAPSKGKIAAAKKTPPTGKRAPDAEVIAAESVAAEVVAASATPSAGRVAAAKRRKLRQSSLQMPAVSAGESSATALADPIAPDEGTKPVPGSAPTPTPSKGRTLTASRGRVSTASRGGVEAAGAPSDSAKGIWALVVAALLASALIGGAVAVKVGGNKDAGKNAVADARPSTPPAPVVDSKPVPVAVDPGSGTTKGGALDDERVQRALTTAATLESDGKEDEASLALEAALETASGEGRTRLIDARNQLLARLRDQIDRAKALAMSGKPDEARKLLASLRGHYPDSLGIELDQAERSINSRVGKSTVEGSETQGGQPVAPTPEEKAKPAKPADLPKPADDPGVRRADELARTGVARGVISKALLELDIAGARAALEAVGSVADPDAVAAVALDRKRIDAVAKLMTSAATGFRLVAAMNQKDTDVELRDGTHVLGKIASADAKQVVVTTAAGPVPVRIDALSQDCLLRTAYLAAADDPEPYFFGRGVLLLCAGDRKGALEAFAQAPGVPESAAFQGAIASHEGSFTAPGVGGGATGEKKKPDASGPVVIGPDGEPFEKPHVKTWMDDTEGGVPWEKAVDYPSKHYTLHTNVKKEYALRYLKLLEAIAVRYEMIFDFHGNDFAYNKNMVLLYRTQEEFMNYEQMPPNVGGFYNPEDKKLHLFHGPWKGAEEITTLNVIAHEAVHQFQNLVLRQMDHAPTFVIEGFSTWAEGAVISKEGEVIVGAISISRLKGMRRAFKANDYVHLKDLIRTSHAEFTGFHYSHTWGLFHWCFFGPESGFAHDYKPIGKSMKLLLSYWQMCCAKPTTAKDFEDLVRQIFGWDMNQLEKAWKDWILSLDPAHDPEIEKYEKIMHKKFVNMMGPTEGK